MHTNISTLFYNHLQNQNGHSLCSNNGSKMIVEVAFEFCSIGEIDTLKETFQAAVVIESKWSTTESFAKYEPSKHWNPMLYVDNALDVKETVFYEVVEDNGLFRTVTEIRSIKGTFWERLDLEYFPFDVQELELVLTSKLGSDKLELVSDPHKLSYIAFEAKTRFKDQQKWRLFRFVTTSDTTCYENEKITKRKKKGSHSLQEIIRHRKKFKPPKLVASCYSARRPGFYIINAFFLIFLITLISFTVFSIDINSPQFRLQAMFTILLAAISLKWAILKRLPSISYLTLLDLYQISQFIFICMIVTWHAVQASYFPTHNLDPTMMVFFLFLFFLKHILFIIWVYSINNKRRQLQKEELLYFTKFKQHFINSSEDSV